MERKYSVPSNPDSRVFSGGTTSEDLHAWSIYRQNLNSDFTDSALGSTDKSPLPYGNFQLRDTTVQSILSHPRYGPKSALGSNMYTYLKFGLPRVFPPNHNGSNRSGTPVNFTRNASARPGRALKHGNNRNLRDGSSGYDSSDNDTPTHNHHQHYKNSRKYRSDPDFRMQMHQQQGGPLPLAAMQQQQQQQQSPQTNRYWNKNKSISEANLLAINYNKNYRDPRRNSVADFIHDHHRPISKAESHLSLAASRRGPASVIRNDYLSQDEDPVTGFIYPHLQVNSIALWPNSANSCFNSNQHLLLNEVSFEIRAGEIMAVMSTSEEEGTAILDLIAGLRNPVLGSIMLNGQNVRAHNLKHRVSYVQSDTNLCKDMTVLQTLRFHYDLKKPTDKLGYLKISPIERINVLIEDLGLEQVRNTKVSSMTLSEKRRLNVACHLILDTDIIVLDQPTKGMDIFDTFFLIEYLKQWANGGAGNTLGRIVILTLHPPTYEIFTMLSRILLVSAGRVMFSGKRRDMLPYFALVEYPCPSFKNPSDYYLDLVTLDDLSSEAMLESSQRIEQLAEIFRQKQQELSDPGPPAALPMTVKKSNFLVQFFTLFTKFMVYTQPNTFNTWLFLIMLSTSLSLIVGTIFWDVPSSDQQLNLNDRQGFHYGVMCVTLWPILISLTHIEVEKNKKSVERDVKDGLYGRLIYIITKSLINLFPSLFVWLIYIVISYSMTGLYMQSSNDYNGFYIYIGVMLLYLSCVQIIQMLFIYLIPLKTTSTLLQFFITTSLFITSGYSLHLKDIPAYFNWLQYLTPTGWLMPYLLNRELSPGALKTTATSQLCEAQHKIITIQLSCPPPNGTNALKFFGYLQSDELFVDYNNAPLAMVIFYLIIFFVVCVSFLANFCGKSKRNGNNGNDDGNRP